MYVLRVDGSLAPYGQGQRRTQPWKSGVMETLLAVFTCDDEWSFVFFPPSFCSRVHRLLAFEAVLSLTRRIG